MCGFAMASSVLTHKSDPGKHPWKACVFRSVKLTHPWWCLFIHPGEAKSKNQANVFMLSFTTQVAH